MVQNLWSRNSSCPCSRTRLVQHWHLCHQCHKAMQRLCSRPTPAAVLPSARETAPVGANPFSPAISPLGSTTMRGLSRQHRPLPKCHHQLVHPILLQFLLLDLIVARVAMISHPLFFDSCFSKKHCRLKFTGWRQPRFTPFPPSNRVSGGRVGPVGGPSLSIRGACLRLLLHLLLHFPQVRPTTTHEVIPLHRSLQFLWTSFLSTSVRHTIAHGGVVGHACGCCLVLFIVGAR